MSDQILGIWLPLVAAALVQASFSLGVSMLTLLSGHLLSQEKSAQRRSRLSLMYIGGALTVTGAGLIALIYLLQAPGWANSSRFWTVLTGASVGVGLAVMLFYYRWDKQGTRLWLPRRAAEYLYARTKATRRAFEAYVLGGAAVVAELIFVAAPLAIAAGLIAPLPRLEQIAAVVTYVIIVLLPLLALFAANVGGHKISRLQRWRERNKRFLQVAAGVLLIILGGYLLTYKVLGAAA